jgi:PDZ domain/Aspartyl protease
MFTIPSFMNLIKNNPKKLSQTVKSIYCLFFFSFCINPGYAQEIVNPRSKAKLITRFPFKQYNGGVMVVNALLDKNTDTLNFILDTGSSGISLDSNTCSFYNIETKASDTIINGMGGLHKVAYVFNRDLRFPGLTVDKLNFHVSNYGILTSVYGERIDGIIGYSFFKRFIVKVDFDNSMIEVYNPGKIEYPKGGTILRPSINRIPLQELTIRDRKKINFNFYFDTGAGLCFLMSEAFSNDSNILSKRRKPFYSQVEGIGGKLQLQLTVVKSIQVGKYRFTQVPTYIYNDESNVTAYPYGGGLVGNDLLRRFNLTINYPEGEIYLLPNSHFNDSFDYSYTGLGIYIEDIMPGSPGEKAGIREGDILIGVGLNFSNSIIQYKALLQSANEKIKLVVKRNGELMELTIKPISIF